MHQKHICFNKVIYMQTQWQCEHRSGDTRQTSASTQPDTVNSGIAGLDRPGRLTGLSLRIRQIDRQKERDEFEIRLPKREAPVGVVDEICVGTQATLTGSQPIRLLLDTILF